MDNSRWVAYAILRITLGSVFFFYGAGKFVAGITNVAHSFQEAFAKTWLPPSSVYAFTVLLPFLEVTIGALLVLGLFTYYAAAAAGLLILQLTLGETIKGDAMVVALNLVYALIIYLLIYQIKDNGLSVDRMGRRE